MRTFASLLLAAFFFPVVAQAATAPELMTKMNMAPGATFSVTARVHQDDMYVSVWLKGTGGYTTPSLDAAATMDIVQGDMNARLKGDVRVNADGIFMRLREATGTFDNEFAHGMMSAYTKKWIQIGDATMSELYFIGLPLDVGQGAAGVELGDESFTVQSFASGGGTKHIMQLKPDAAAELARSILDLLGGDRPVIQDFFPWRALAESLQFEVTVQENSQGVLQSRTANINVQGENSYFVFDSTETFLAASPVVATPTDMITLEAIENLFGNNDVFTDESGWEESDWEETDWEESDETMDMWEEDTDYLDFYNGSFEDIDEEEGALEEFDWEGDQFEVYSSTCFTTDDASLVMLQRSGECPVEKVSRRNLVR